MSTKYLGRHFDIHGGGLDNQFPHHECEIAQSEEAYNEPFVNYWMHNNMVTLEGKKMGKSLGNAISLDQFFRGDHKLLSRPWDPQIIRFFLLQSHYRSTTDFSESALAAAESGLENLHKMIRTIDEAQVGEGEAFDLQSFKCAVEHKLNDDFNTAQALAELFEHLKQLRKQINEGNAPSNLEDVQAFLKRFVDGVLGIWPNEDAELRHDKTDELIRLIIDLRNKARREKNFDLADTIRDRLDELGVELMDRPGRTDYNVN
jgi:cysteinyl-tRNA synthetase